MMQGVIQRRWITKDIRETDARLVITIYEVLGRGDLGG
jgi:hypothetical protein